ncbi:MAG: ATP-binding cassette domain-containing protein [Edaphobacter sp.]
MKHRQGALIFDLAFTLTEPWTVLFGPSGSGKTTVLRTIAGFVRPATGRIFLQARSDTAERILLDTSTRTFVPAHRRKVRFAAQTPALFPNLTVRENISYGASSDQNAIHVTTMVTDALERFRITTLATKRPMQLSGGERQRVAVARAAVSAVAAGDESLLLLDEPFAGLDLRLRDELLLDLREWLAASGTPVLSVTHDVGEAFQLGAEVIKIAEGRVIEQGPVRTVLAMERERLMEQLREN